VIRGPHSPIKPPNGANDTVSERDTVEGGIGVLGTTLPIKLTGAGPQAPAPGGQITSPFKKKTGFPPKSANTTLSGVIFRDRVCPLNDPV